MTGRHGRNRKKRDENLAKHFKEAVSGAGLVGNQAAAIRVWNYRRQMPDPVVEKRGKGARVDVHVLSYSRPSGWLRQTLDSLEGEPCNTHIVVGGFHGSIGKARAYAFQLGQAEYVSFVDDDDIVLPGVMQSLVDYLDEHPDCVGVYTDLYHVNENSPGRRDLERKGPWRPMRQFLHCPEITHLKVMRREVVEEYLDEVAKWPTYEEYVLVGMMCEKGRWQHIPVPGILKRYTAFSSSSMRLTNVPLWKRAVARITPAIMQAHRRQGCGR